MRLLQISVLVIEKMDDFWEIEFERRRDEAELARYYEAVELLPLSMTCRQMRVPATCRILELALYENGLRHNGTHDETSPETRSDGEAVQSPRQEN